MFSERRDSVGVKVADSGDELDRISYEIVVAVCDVPIETFKECVREISRFGAILIALVALDDGLNRLCVVLSVANEGNNQFFKFVRRIDP